MTLMYPVCRGKKNYCQIQDNNISFPNIFSFPFCLSLSPFCWTVRTSLTFSLVFLFNNGLGDLKSLFKRITQEFQIDTMCCLPVPLSPPCLSFSIVRRNSVRNGRKPQNTYTTQ